MPLLFAGSRLAVALAVTSWLASLAVGQSEVGSAALRGVVHDPSGAVVPKATVLIRHLATGYQRSAVSDSSGRFSADVLPVGPYSVEVSAPGFSPVEFRDVLLTVGNAETLSATLPIPTLAHQVTVTAEPAEADGEIASEGASVGTRQVERLPIRGRNFTDLVQFTPGVIQEADRSGLVISGQRSINSNVAIDGADYNDPLLGNQRGGNEPVFSFPQSAIREFQVVRSGAGVEVGRTTAGFVNAVTRAGGNSWHGSALYHHRDRHLTSPDAFGRSLDNRQDQFGGSLGGPVRRDRRFVFLAAEKNLLRVPFVVEFRPQKSGVLVPLELRALEGEQRGTNNPLALFARFDDYLGSRHSLNLQYSLSRMRGENFNFESARLDEAAQSNYRLEGASHTVRAGLISVFGPTAVNEFRAQLASDEKQERPNLFAPQIVIKGFGNLGGDADRPRAFDSRRTQVLDQLSMVRGRHRLRAGADVNVTHLDQQREANIQGRYDFRSVADYVSGVIDRYRQTIPIASPRAGRLAGYQRELAGFFQDAIHVGKGLSATLGLRWEAQWNPQPPWPNSAVSQTTRIPHDLGMWQPRMGFAWTPDKRTVVRWSAGLFAARTPGTLLQRVFTDNGIATHVVDSKIDRSVLQAVHFPEALSSVPAGAKVAVPRVFGFDPTFRNPRSFQAAVTIDRRFGGLSLSAGFVRNSAWKLQRRLDRNLFPPAVDATGMPVFRKQRPDPSVGQLSINESSAHSSYDGLVATAAWQAGRHLQLQAHYTLAHNQDDDSNERNYSKEFALSPFDLSIERSWSKQDVRHNGNLAAVYGLPAGLSLSIALIARSGLPYTAVVGFDTQNDGNDENDRAILDGRVAGRNSRRQPGFLDLDFRLARAWSFGRESRLELLVDVFNATKASNRNYGSDGVSEFGLPEAPVATAGQPLYAPSTARFGGPRQLQVGIRLLW